MLRFVRGLRWGKMTPMPTILRAGPYRFHFNSYDWGEPRHAHADRENCSAKFWLDPDAALSTNHGYGRRELRNIERIVRENLELLKNECDEFCKWLHQLGWPDGRPTKTAGSGSTSATHRLGRAVLPPLWDSPKN